jgi:hypothetical protein
LGDSEHSAQLPRSGICYFHTSLFAKITMRYLVPPVIGVPPWTALPG